MSSQRTTKLADAVARPDLEQQWLRCKGCTQWVLPEALSRLFGVCPHCKHHHRISALSHIAVLIDLGTFEEYDQNLSTADPIQWNDGKPYREVYDRTRAKLDVNESFVYGLARVNERPVLIGSFDFRFFGGTLGCVAGEKLARLFEHATHMQLPVVICTQSGGARMQEGLYSLYQMSKIATVLRRFQDRGGLSVHILCDPTTGGVAASLSFLGDYVWAEPHALIGFSGPRVILEAIGQELPDGSQTSESLLSNGLIDAVVPRDQQRARLIDLLRIIGAQSAVQ